MIATSFGRWYMVAACGFALSGAVSVAAQMQAPVALENGRIQQGPFLLFGDDKGGLHLMRGSDVLLRGIGMRCGNGGYWPYDRMANNQVTFGNGTLAFRAQVPGKQVFYGHDVSIAGDRVRFLLQRRGDWGQDHWDGFSFYLPMQYYKGAQLRADGQTMTYPEHYMAGHAAIASGVRRLECHAGDPSLNLVFECSQDISVSDTRQYSGQTYEVSVRFPRGEAEAPVELFLTLPQAAGFDAAAVRYSRIGYPSAGVKSVVLEWPRHMARPDDGVRLERRDGSVVKEGRFGETVDVEYTQCGFASFDFSEVKDPGDYRVVWSGGAVEFPIRQSVFDDRLWEPALDFFLPFQMCHADVNLGDASPGHRKCHMDDAVRVPANSPGVDGFVSYECEGTPYSAGDYVPLAKGAWHDAGDSDLNINTQSFCVWVLSLAYEEFGINRDVAALDAQQQTWTYGKPDGVPDILQQVEWGALWLLSMEQPDGRVYVGVIDTPDRYSLGGRTVDKATDNKPGTGDERQLYVDYHSDLQLMQATGLCAASRALGATNPELSQRCLDAAVKAFDYFHTHKEVYRKTVYFYPETKGRDGAVAAALAELYMTTGDASYLRMLDEMRDAIRDMNFSYPYVSSTTASSYWYAPPVLARLYPALPEGALKNAVLEVCRRAAKGQADYEAPRPWPFRYWYFGTWGNNSSALARVFDAYWLSKVAPETFSVRDALRTMLWIFGLHPLNDRVFVSGIGYPGPEYIHSGQIFGLLGTEPGTVPGAVVPGINGIFAYVPQNVLYYRDDGNAGNNEVGEYSAVLYLFAVKAMQRSGL
jgi:hypothetical protein